MRKPSRIPVAPPPELPLLDDNTRLIQILCRITGRPAEEVRQRLIDEQRQLGTNVNREMQRLGVPRFVWSEALERFYAETDAFLFELVAWNRNRNKRAIRAWIAERLARVRGGPLDVLTFGDGLGFDSLSLALAGHRVQYLEVGERSRAFARALFDEARQVVMMPLRLEEIAPESLDAVVCLDVLEHVPDPPALIDALARRLRPGGVFVVSAPFFMQVREFPTHLACNRHLSGSITGLYGRFGLRLLDGRTFLDPMVLGKAPLAPIGTWRDRLRVRMGAGLLWVARFWAWPHRVIGNALQKRGYPGSNWDEKTAY